MQYRCIESSRPRWFLLYGRKIPSKEIKQNTDRGGRRLRSYLNTSVVAEKLIQAHILKYHVNVSLTY